MDAPKFEARKTRLQGKPAIELIVRNSLASPKLHALIESLGYQAVVDISNCRSIVCTTAEEIDTARNPLMQFFGAGGVWKS
jgi:hypothetical protein